MAGSEYYKLKVFSKSCLFVIGSSFLLSCLVCSPRIHILPPSQVAAKDLVAVDEEVQQKALKTFYER